MIDTFDWDALKSFLAVARIGRLTVAARELGIDHATLHRRIVALETVLGARLFERRPSGYALTAKGGQLMDAAEAMERAAYAVLRDLSDASRPVTGVVRIGTPDGFGSMFLAPRLGKLVGAHPGLGVQLVTRPRYFSLPQREADLAVTLTRPRQGRLKARKLTDYELGLYATREYLEAHDAIASQDDLKRHALIGYIDEMIFSPELDYLPQIAREARVGIASSNLLAQLQATLSGAGLCVLPCFMADGEPRLTRVLAPSIALRRTFWLNVHEDIAEIARVRVAAEFMATEARAARALFLPGA